MTRTSKRGFKVLTESQVQRSFRALFQGAEVSAELLDRAEDVIEQLRLESPLRHRLTEELTEPRELYLAANK